jgi:mannose/cellobiose epimerase-like protein (N-acyl-D-glucosamine 2-epimerase family)
VTQSALTFRRLGFSHCAPGPGGRLRKLQAGTTVPPADLIRFDDVRAWIFEAALPLWLAAGLDARRGGSVEALDFDGRDAAIPFKRVRAQARQVYAFSQAHLWGVAGAGAAADHVWAFLERNARREDGGWVRLLDRAGDVLDPAADAYDMAFILYAIAWRARAGDPEALAKAHAVLDALERLLGLGRGLGFRAAEDRPDARLQNPHMHLLEAALELAGATGDARFADLAGDMTTLFTDRMLTGGVLVEAYDADWRPIRGERQKIEPGHLYEWTWLLHRAEAVTGRRLREEARALTAFAEAHGLDPDTRFAVDALSGEALARKPVARLWPQTEALKAHLALFEHQGIDGRARIAEITSQLLDRYLAVAPRGGWMDRFGPGWTPAADNVPASILYHLLVAFAELLRLEPALRGAPVSPAPARG